MELQQEEFQFFKNNQTDTTPKEDIKGLLKETGAFLFVNAFMLALTTSALRDMADAAKNPHIGGFLLLLVLLGFAFVGSLTTAGFVRSGVAFLRSAEKLCKAIWRKLDR
ncbi:MULTISPECIES: hypothetical protein [Burkholderiaceae]|jgi:hypothetical protein|uniref:Uncharacterized protein n=2 Tax=Burkholderiaceae TaxID=119060 RepID=A0A6J5JHV8_9BURK|nr:MULTISPECIES: hypothetical protein [Burkholderiaceae]ANJ73089.1 hypothetical protein A9Y76_11675 [Ralstonia insidiosa]KAB0601847.1 hypothetical protein F7R19_15210 [Cupriavidus pauculus]MBR8498372.1 hypothetical protein [Burkholderia cenocepacia]MCO8395340.1 hypothetical protein [Burkholderia cenocepacia]MCO8403209.1 hypothetical protein [Burkholderia cenocepacia]